MNAYVPTPGAPRARVLPGTTSVISCLAFPGLHSLKRWSLRKTQGGSFYFLFVARKGITGFFYATVFGRAAATLVFLALVAFKLGPVQLLLFAAVDFLTAIWTHLALKRERAV